MKRTSDQTVTFASEEGSRGSGRSPRLLPAAVAGFVLLAILLLAQDLVYLLG